MLVTPGLIPARAGNTLWFAGYYPLHGAHPRSRGEHQDGHTPVGTVEGSSPLARGTQSGTLSALGAQGLIPARAGNTGGSEEAAGVVGAHPRSRGEH